MVGRGTRPLPGVVDGPETAEERRMAIADSAKSDCIVLDFCGNTGKHSLVSLTDILGGKMPDEVVKRAKEIVEKESDSSPTPIDVVEMLERAAREIEEEEKKAREKRKRSIVKGRAKVDVREVDPFKVYGMPPRKESTFRVLPLTDGQKDLLRKQGVPFERLSTWQQRELFKETVKRFKQDRCSFRQAQLLTRYGYSPDCSFTEAKVIIDRLAKNGWKKEDVG